MQGASSLAATAGPRPAQHPVLEPTFPYGLHRSARPLLHPMTCFAMSSTGKKSLNKDWRIFAGGLEALPLVYNSMWQVSDKRNQCRCSMALVLTGLADRSDFQKEFCGQREQMWIVHATPEYLSLLCSTCCAVCALPQIDSSLPIMIRCRRAPLPTES